jgi:hypothetical protein
MGKFLLQMRDLLRDRAFVWSAALSIAVTVIFISTSIYLFGFDKINITKIAQVSITEVNKDSRENEINAKPISGIFQLANRDFSAPRTDEDIAALESQIWHGYLIKLETFCQISNTYNQNVGVWIAGKFTPLHEIGISANVIVKATNRTTAGIIKINAKTCELAKTLNDNEQIYIVSDAPVSETESYKTYLSIVKIDK